MLCDRASHRDREHVRTLNLGFIEDGERVARHLLHGERSRRGR